MDVSNEQICRKVDGLGDSVDSSFEKLLTAQEPSIILILLCRFFRTLSEGKSCCEAAILGLVRVDEFAIRIRPAQTNIVSFSLIVWSWVVQFGRLFFNFYILVYEFGQCSVQSCRLLLYTSLVFLRLQLTVFRPK